jgi:predicted Zn-dependent protease with MMP-like domain
VSGDRDDALEDAEDIEEERHRLEALVRGGDRSALLDLAHLALQVAGDDDEDALRAGAKLVRDAIARCRDDEQLLLEAWELVPESIINFARAWPEAETLAAAASDLGADDPVATLVRGLLAFYAGRFRDADEALRAVPDDAVAAHWLGCALERLGREEEADQELARAAELDGERFVRPIRMTEDEFRDCMETAFAELPDEIRDAIEGRCALVVEDFPGESAIASGLDPLNLGEFRGDDLGVVERGTSEVVLYKKNLEKICGSRDELVEEARVTLFHEIGHALGFEEDGVDDLGLA